MPTNPVQVQLTEHRDGTRMELHSVFDSRNQMERLIGSGASLAGP